MNFWIGNLGHLFVILSFTLSLAATYSFYQATRFPLEKGWRNFARLLFVGHGIAVMGVIACLFAIIYTHRYEYHYAWSHSSRTLPAHYMISCFWEGQEGSFLLWIFWHVFIGLFLMPAAKQWEAPVMTVFSAVQVFLTSMILGVVIFGSKFGSSPFILLRDAMPDLPVFVKNPNFVPEDGTGLNPLLQNPWMVIHPPTLFAGFALTLVPFAFAIAGLWQKQYKEWIKPTLPWALTAAAVLGTGIMMGAIWAYETLNFGGYWNWDPVENAVYIPWLILVAAIHVMITYKKNNSALSASFILSLASFVLILYATFLTRSGVLGEASVHSFTDLGLSGQLLIYLVSFVLLSVVLLIVRWKEIPKSQKEVTTYSREFWIFMGVTILSLAAFQVLVPTSIPVLNSVAKFFGVTLNLAPPADQIAFYTKWQLWFGVAIAAFSGVGQFFWWKKIDNTNWLQTFVVPLILTMLSSSILIAAVKIHNFAYIVLISTSFFALFTNGQIFWRLVKHNYRLSGGAVAHFGVALMLLGILFSSGYSETISINKSGLLFNKNFTDEQNTENVLLWRNKPQEMGSFLVTYKGPCFETENGLYVRQDDAWQVGEREIIAKKDIEIKGKLTIKKGDTVLIKPENTYYEVSYKTENGKEFTLYPRAQINPNMGLLASPDIQVFAHKDVYTHISSIPDPNQERIWSDEEEIAVAMGDTFFVNDYVAHFTNIYRVNEVDGIPVPEGSLAFRAEVTILAGEQEYKVRPAFVVTSDGNIGRVPITIEDLAARLTLLNINPETGLFTFGLSTTQKDWIIMKAVEKPMINLLWIGTGLLIIGFIMAILRRHQDFAKTQHSPTPKKEGNLAVAE